MPFCTACGAPLEPSEAQPPILEERKIVTALFADLVGFTGRAEQLDPEDVRRMLAPYHARVKTELESYGGTVEKFIGDAVVALFGAPLAHEDDPERGVRAAVAARDALGELNAADPTLGLHVRIGVTTGEAMIALSARPKEGEGMATGDVVNTASRLQSAAPVDGILVDETTFRATSTVIEYRDAEPVHAKGKSEPVRVWEVVAPRTRLGVDIAFRGGAELIGREQELRLLRDALARSERERAPQLVTLVGAPGIGKSRLLFELYAALDDDPEVFANWRQGRSLPYGEGVSFWALGEMVKAQAGILESDSSDEAAAKLGTAVTTVVHDEVEAQWVDEHLGPLVGLEGPEAAGGDLRREAFAAWRRFFESLAETRPLVLVFEDIHWADEGLLDFVDHLVDWATDVPILVVCTARPELLERRPGWGGGKRSALTVSLSPLSDDDIERLLRALLAERSVPQARVDDLLAHAGGNPLYAEEFVRMLAENGADAGLPLPETVQGIIAARLDTLAGEEKALVQDAAVVGKVFWVGALAAVSDRPTSEVEQGLQRLERTEFVRRERRSSVAGETAFVFRHVLVRDVAYGQIPRPRRAELHRRTAGWLESLAGDRAEDIADLIAHHYLSALQFARAAGRGLGDLPERARIALVEAGDRALALSAYAPAVRFYREALASWPDDDPERPPLLLRYGQALFRAEQTGAEVLVEAANELLAAGEVELAAEAQVLLGDLLMITQGRREEASLHFETGSSAPRRATLVGLEGACAGKPSPLASGGRRGPGGRRGSRRGPPDGRRPRAGRARGARAQHERLLPRDDRRPRRPPRPAGKRQVASSANSPQAARGYNNLASITADLGDLERAFELYAESRRAARRFGDALALRWLDVERVYECYWRGNWTDALEIGDRLLGEGEDGLGSLHDVDVLLIRAKILLAREGAEPALECVEKALAVARSVGAPQILFPVLAFQAHALVAAGQGEAASDVAQELLAEWLDRGRGHSLASFWLADLTFALVELGRADELMTRRAARRPRRAGSRPPRPRARVTGGAPPRRSRASARCRTKPWHACAPPRIWRPRTPRRRPRTNGAGRARSIERSKPSRMSARSSSR